MRSAAWASLIALALPASILSGQKTRVDSAAALAAKADSLTALSTAEALQSAITVRHLAQALFHGLADSTAEAMQLQRLGIAYSNLGKSDSARVYFTRALELRRAKRDRVGEIRSLNALGIVHEMEAHYDSAIMMYQAALSAARAIANRPEQVGPLMNISNVFLKQSVPDSVRWDNGQVLPLAREAGDKEAEGQIESNMSIFWKDMGHADSGLVHARRSFVIATELKDTRTIAAAILNIGTLHFELGQTDSAMIYYQRAFEAYERLGIPSSMRNVLNQRGIAFQELNQLDSAIITFRKMAALARADDDPVAESTALSNLAIAFRRGGQLDSALATARSALVLKRKVEDREGEGIALHVIGTTHFAAARADSALANFRKVDSIAVLIENPGLRASALNGLGLVFAMKMQVDSAAHYLNEDLRLARASQDPRGEGESLQALAELYRLANDNKRATFYFDSATSVTASVREHVSGDFDRLTLAERQLILYEGWTLAWLARAPEVGARRAAYAALAAAERGRARALLDLMRESSPPAPVGVDLAAEGERLVAGVLAEKDVVVSYQATPDTLVVIAASRDGIDVARIAINRDSLGSIISDFRRAIQVEGGRGGRSAGEAGGLSRSLEVTRGVEEAKPRQSVALAVDLSRLLIPARIRPRIASAREILFVPQGVVALVPFGALAEGPSQRPMGLTHAIRYVPSLGIARQVQLRPGQPFGRTRGGSDALVAGNPIMPTVRTLEGAMRSLPPLPGAAIEADLVSRRLGGVPLTGAAASEAEIRRRLPSADVVHLATHGFAYSAESQARRSFVALASGNGQDGLLTVGELLDDPSLRLHAELVVLSACQTGLGDLKQAEGTIGLQRAVLARGARSVLVSLWSVSDEATLMLMDRFYAHWIGDSDQPTKAEALHRAQAEVRAKPQFAHPRYWAAFQLVGAP